MKGFTKKRCKRCNSADLSIWVRDSCEGCIYNGIYNEQEKCYEWPEEADPNQRIQVSEEGECKLGYTNEMGCTLMECKSCGKLEHFPWM